MSQRARQRLTSTGTTKRQAFPANGPTRAKSARIAGSRRSAKPEPEPELSVSRRLPIPTTAGLIAGAVFWVLTPAIRELGVGVACRGGKVPVR
jgi:hypothetical protein